MTGRPQSAPAAHFVTYRPDPGGGGVLVGHLRCSAPEVFVPSMPGQPFVLAIDTIQAILGHECPPDEGDSLPGTVAGWV